MKPLSHRPLRALLLPGLALSLVGFAAACGVEGGPPRVGDELPPFEVETLDGQAVSLAEYSGRPVLLNLWATWCPPCRAEMPYLQALHEEYEGRGLALVGLSMDTPSAKPAVEAFLEETAITYDVRIDPSMSVMDDMGALGLPVTLLVDHTGTITFFRMGPVEEGDAAFETAIEDVVTRWEAA